MNIQIPLLTLAGRHGSNLSIGLTYDSKPLLSLNGTWNETEGHGDYTFGPPDDPAALPGGWRLNIPMLQANVHTILTPGPTNSACYKNFMVVTADGSSHTFANIAGCATTLKNSPFTVTPDNASNSTTATADDLPVLLLDTSNPADYVLRGKDGTSFHFFANFGLATASLTTPPVIDADPVFKLPDEIVDANGNIITITNSNGNLIFTDNAGRVVTLTYGSLPPNWSSVLNSVSYLDSTGVQRTITLSYSNFSFNYTLAQPQNLGGALSTSGTIPFLSSVTYPNGLSYNFQYNTSAGELSKVTYPTGGYTRYDFQTFVHWWQASSVTDVDADTPADYREVTAKHVCRDAQGNCTLATEDMTTYSPTIDGTMTNNQYMDVTDPLGNRTRYNFSFHPSTVRLQLRGDPFLARELFRYSYQGSTTLLRTVQTEYNNLDANGLPTVLSAPIRITTTLNDSNQVKKVEYDYDTDVFDNVIAERDYDFGPGAFGALLRRTSVSWLKTNSVNSVNYIATGVHILNRKLTDTVYDSVNNTCQGQNRPCAQTLYEYDNYTLGISASGAVQHSTAYGAGNTVRGNITAIQAYRNTDGAFLTTRNQYDDAGNILSVTDPRNNTTSFSYSDSWSNSACAPTGGSAAAYLTSTTNPKLQVSSIKYNSCTGSSASATDVNGQTTTFSYDAMDRLVQTVLPADVNGHHPQSSVAFNESSLPLSVTATSYANVVSTVTMDGLGRTVKKAVNSDPLGLIVDITYDSLGRKATESNTHRTQPGSTDGITQFAYDALGRPTQVTHPDNSFVTTAYNGTATQVTDEGNGTKTVQRISQTDGLGRLASVCEVSSGPFVGAGGVSSASLVGPAGTPASCGQVIAATGFLTTYTYGVLGDLTGVSQGGTMQRSFIFDSLSHLLQSTNPESGVISYTYDNGGNVLTRTDARNITTTYSYDQLNRLTGKTYASGGVPDPLTPSVTLTYDVCPAGGCPVGMSTQNLVGRLVSASNGTATTFSAYDALGRVINQWQCTPLNCGSGYFSQAYNYSLGSDITSETNGLGVTLSYGYDAVDRLQSATSNLSDVNHPATLLSGVQYGPIGITAETLGNGVTEAVGYTNRGQLQNVAVGGIAIINHPATSGSGSVTIGGTEQSVVPPATVATGSVTISGSEQRECLLFNGPTCSDWEYDAGSVSITVGSFTVSSNFSQLLHNSATALAQDLTTKLNGSGSPVTASLSGTVISLTSIATGSAANLSLSSSATSTDGMNSFSGTPSGATLTGGSGGQTVWDAGSVTATVNGTAYTVSYGSGSTSTTIASALASALSAGTLVNGSASGSVVIIIAKSTGSVTNYTLSASSSTSHPQGQFSGPSFTATPSGAALTGGANSFTTTQGATIYSLAMGYAPNGNVLSANDSVNGNWTYSYDDFNRLVGASQNGGQQTYNYVYDRYGNRWQQNAPQGGNVQLLVFNSGTNRMDGYTYDASGNLLNDGTNAFTYDAESQLVQSVKSGATTTYVYDAGGRRVRKSVAGVTTDYVYNLGGTVTEVNSTGVWSRTEVYTGGKHLATYAGGASGTTYFNHTDWLGTERVRSDMTGAACETVTSLIFGDGQSVSGGCGDPSTRHFTGKQRDDESGLDDFGARYYSSQLGRFVSADWSAVPAPVPYANLTNPQTLNLYALVHENPSTFADLDGHLAPGQLGAPGGMAVQPRMRSANANAYGCLDTGCDVVLFALRITYANGTTSTQYFSSQLEAEAAWLQQPVQNNPGQQTTATTGMSGQDRSHFVSISYWPTGAKGFGHIGIQVDSDDTQGFSTNDPTVPFLKRLFGAPAARTEDDIAQHTKNGVVAPHFYLHLSITADQAGWMQGEMTKRFNNPGHYNLIFNNCADFVESVLRAGKVSGVPHSEIFGPPILGGILWYGNTLR
ncbi:MAG TPA: RHS repeat-associated core domain-containing protein [Candidatus Angelobacter sp.]|nr:RHS repeat-associated core domain-containing protein [Candidatus Angelobacter sp.]